MQINIFRFKYFIDHIVLKISCCKKYLRLNQSQDLYLRRHYETNRAPLGLYFHTLWFKNKKNRKAFRRFLDDIVSTLIVDEKEKIYNIKIIKCKHNS
jgi:hypothetical protein